jgi:hypothetical protein
MPPNLKKKNLAIWCRFGTVQTDNASTYIRYRKNILELYGTGT